MLNSTNPYASLSVWSADVIVPRSISISINPVGLFLMTFHSLRAARQWKSLQKLLERVKQAL